MLVDGVVVSSSAIRSAVREGRVEEAARMLGRPFALAGEIQSGTGLGRKVVVPTLNLATEQETLPKTGVYATEVVVGGKIVQSRDECRRASDVRRASWRLNRIYLIFPRR